MIRHLNLVIWLVAGTLQLSTCVLLVRRGLAKEQRTFFIFLCFETIKCFGVLAAKYRSYSAYFWLYWCSQAIALLLASAVLQDLVEQAAAHMPSARQMILKAFFICSAAACMVAAVSALITSGAEASSIVAAVLVAERSFRILQGVLIIFIALSWLTFQFRMPTLGIAIFAGMATIVIVNLVAINMRWAAGSSAKATYALVKQISETAVYLAWAVACYQTSPARNEDTVDPALVQRLRSAVGEAM